MSHEIKDLKKIVAVQLLYCQSIENYAFATLMGHMEEHVVT